MDETANLSLPYIMPSQAQKYVTHNEALRDLDSIVHLAVLDRDLAAPPSSPTAGDRYLVATGATGTWSGQSGNIAAFQDGAWRFYVPQKGWRVWIGDEALLLAFTAGGWVVASGASINPAPMVGVLATADSTNRLSVRSNAVLFANDDLTPGTGDMRVAVSKASVGKNASVAFEDNRSGRAEMGLAGDDDFQLKVSPDGAAWTEAIHVSSSTGLVGIGSAAPAARLTVSNNAGAVPAPTADTAIHVAGADGATSRINIDCFGSTVSPNITFRHARGTAVSPSAIQLNDQILNAAAFGYGATGYSASTRGGFIIYAAENWSDTAQGTQFALLTTAMGTTSTLERMRLDAFGNVGIGISTPVDRLHLAQDDAANAGIAEMLRLTHTTSGSPGIGIGAGIEFEVETATGENTEIGMRLDTVATSVTGAAENFDFVVRLMTGGAAAAEAFRVKAGGKLSLAGGAFAANGSVATALSSVGPTGAHTSVQKWLVFDDAGTARYVPCF